MGLIGVYSFAGHARGEGLSQFLQNEAAGGITTSKGTQKVRCYRSFCRMKQLGVLLLHRVPKRSGVIPVFEGQSSWGIITSQGTQEVTHYPSFGRMKQLGVLLLHTVPKRSGVLQGFVELSKCGYYYFTGYPRCQALSQFFQG